MSDKTVTVPVIFVEASPAAGEPAAGRTSGDREHGLLGPADTAVTRIFGGGTLVRRDLDVAKIADGIVGIASGIGRGLRCVAAEENGMKLKQISVGCAIEARGSVGIASAGATASITLVFDLSAPDRPNAGVEPKPTT